MFRNTLVLLALAAATAASQQTDGKIPADAEAVIQRFMQKNRVPGMSFAVGKGGKILWEGAWGFSSVEHGVKATVRTRFRTASIAKPMTAVALMQLVEKGKIDLDADIRKWVPAFPKKKWPITSRQLLGHLGGVRHYKTGAESRGTRHFMSLSDTLTLFADDPLVHEPGTGYRYTTFGFTLPGIAVEKITGHDFEDALCRSIFEPAGMRHTVADDQRRIIRDRARGYQRVNARLAERLKKARARTDVEAGSVIPAALHDTSMKIPGGGLLSTSTDLVRFGQAVLEAKIVSEKTRDLMWTAQKTTAGKSVNYGLGFAVAERNGRREIAHGGGQAGASCFLVIYPDQGLVVAAMTNLEGAPIRPTVRSVAKRLLED